VGFFVHYSQADTSRKGKKMQKKKKHSTSYRMRPTMQQKREKRVSQCSKKEKRKKRKEENEKGRKLRPTVQSRPTADLDLPGHRDPRWRLTGAFLWFFLPVGLIFSWFLR
jgi:hypothetical protein